MRYVLNDPLYLNERCTDKMRTILTETTLMTPTSIHTNQTKHQTRTIRTYNCFEAIVLKLIF